MTANILHFPLTLAERALRSAGYTVLPPVEPEPVEIDLTPTEADVFSAITSIPQPKRTIAALVYHSEGSVKNALTSLKRKGLIARVGHYHRGGWRRIRSEALALAA